MDKVIEDVLQLLEIRLKSPVPPLALNLASETDCMATPNPI